MKTSWHKSDLASVVSTLESGSRPKGGASTETGEVASLGGENIVQSGGVTLAEVKRVPQPFFKRMTKGHLLDGDVLINKDGAQTGKVGIYLEDGRGPACINEHVFLIRGNKEKICQEFLYYTLLSEHGQRQIAAQISGSAQPGLKSSFLKGVITDIPDSFPEQTKIAEVLSTVDQAIEQTTAVIAKQQRIKTGLIQDLLTSGIDEHGNLRSEQTHEFKDSPLGRIPVEWEAASVSSVLAQLPKNGYSPVESSNWNGVYMLGLGCLTANGFKPNQLKYAPKTDRRIKAVLLLQGDFLISRSNTRALVGLVGIFRDVGEPCIYPDLMVRLRFDVEVSVDYMEQVFMSSAIRRQIENSATGTSGSMVKISAVVIKELLFSKPPIEEQLTILSILQSKTEDIRKTRASLEKLRSLKTALIQDLLTGKKRVTALLEKTP